jgi:two-component system chemotaxis response regulator CheY
MPWIIFWRGRTDMRILVADDDATSRLVLKAIASKLGHQCEVAADGGRAWELLASESFDVLLTDWMMPGVEGPELCRRVREELGDRYIYIVLITTLGDSEQVREGMTAGADDYLSKPVDPFAVQTRLVAADRVTALHRQVVDIQAQLERANIDATRRSLTDPLTALGNRRRMEEDLASAEARALRMDRSYGVALFDLDHFKLYNDHYGHLAGDELLRQIAQCFDKSVRAGESVYRYGGEEFLLLLPECSAEGALVAAERLRQAVAAAALPHASRPTKPGVVTLSGGVSCSRPGVPSSFTDLLHQADQALFAAKSAGRNRVVAAPAPVLALGEVDGRFDDVREA